MTPATAAIHAYDFFTFKVTHSKQIAKEGVVQGPQNCTSWAFTKKDYNTYFRHKPGLENTVLWGKFHAYVQKTQ